MRKGNLPAAAQAKRATWVSSPEYGVENKSRNDDKCAERLRFAGSFQRDFVFGGNDDRLPAAADVDDGQNRANDYAHDEADGHAVQERHIRSDAPFQCAVEHGVNQNPEPAEDARALRHEKSEEEHAEDAR